LTKLIDDVADFMVQANGASGSCQSVRVTRLHAWAAGRATPNFAADAMSERPREQTI